MDPNQLAKLYERKSAATAAKAAERQAQKGRQRTELQKRTEQGDVALRDVVIPYFQELVSAFPKGHFTFNSAVKTDAVTHAPVAVSFKIGDGAEHFIEVIQGNVQVWRAHPGKAAKSGKRPAHFQERKDYSPDAEPFIAGPSDLTREKLGKLVEMAIEEL
jgi:hypothetical protein